MLDLYYIYDSKAELYLNLIKDPTTKSKMWLKWNPDALEITEDSTCFGLTVQTRFTFDEIFLLEDTHNISLVGYIQLVQPDDDKHLKI
ncbi:hypothetical protein AM7_028 [Lactococcus phage AM7]|uniref:Uncharacterized protein n=2 Tax=Teubervirus AM6 TaxID=2845190 RepID=A0A1W6JIE7_9CAUD|nr:hypothetical protein H1N71_gp28 [Lactococcus phage AM6]ARM65975.1 hypothetical protein AM6_028 [Lactococcus phage AM6]ARM66065.1 hypothetical protein AM7_028 [Lactococcus phage AM7]